jgi:hypothetical protein
LGFDVMLAMHWPFWQPHEPKPQSKVPGMHILVHMVPLQDGALERLVQDVGWQHVAGTQSEATWHWLGLMAGFVGRGFV